MPHPWPDADALLQAGLSGANLRIVEAVCPLLLSRDAATVSFEALAAQAHVGVATLYRHFPSKGRLYASAARLMWAYVAAGTWVDSAQPAGAGSGADQLRALGRACVEIFALNPGLVRFLGTVDRMASRGQVPADALAPIVRQAEAIYATFEGAYVRGVVDGSLRQVPDFRAAFLAVAHGLLGASRHPVPFHGIDNDADVPSSTVAAAGVDMALAYLGARPQLVTTNA